MLNEEMDRFFKLAVEGISKEDENLKALFNISPQKYSDLHHGVNILDEPIFVYIVFKQLLDSDFPFKVAWEYSYPSKNSIRSDLAFLEDQKPIALVEFKILSNKDDSQIQKDINKLREEKAELSKYLFVINVSGNKEKLINNSELKMIKEKEIDTSVINKNTKDRDNLKLGLFLFEVRGTAV
jgi:hypothetical protein